MSDHRVHEAVYLDIDAPAGQCFDAMLQYETYPQWQSSVYSAEILASDPPRTTVEFKIDVFFKKIRYVLEYEPDPDNYFLKWNFIEGDIMHVDGDFRVEPVSEQSSFCVYRLDIHPGFRVPSPLVKIVKNTAMLGVLRDLQKHLAPVQNI